MPEMRDFILNGSNFRYTPFIEKNKRRGRSGSLLIAQKDDMRLMVKHTYPADIANEFVACYIAEQLGFPHSKAYLLTATSSFRSQFAVGFEFMNLHAINWESITPAQQIDLIHQVSLNALIFQEDTVQLSMWGDRIVSYDFAVAFSQEERFSNLRYAFNRYSCGIMFCPDVALRIMHLSEDHLPDIERIYYDGLQSLPDIDFEPLFQTLYAYFPHDIAEYYEACLYEMQEQVNDALTQYNNRC